MHCKKVVNAQSVNTLTYKDGYGSEAKTGAQMHFKNLLK